MTFFIVKGNGIKFRKDNLLVKNMFSKDDVLQMLKDVNFLSAEAVYKKYDFNETPDWKLQEKKHLFVLDDTQNIVRINYRQFDGRYSYYPLNTINQIIVRGDSRKQLMQNYLIGNNVGLLVGRQGQVVGNMSWNLVFATRHATDMNIFYRGGGINYPLYVTTTGSLLTDVVVPNINKVWADELAKRLATAYMPTIESNPSTINEITPKDIFDYIYAVLHSPSYRAKYQDFLKMDFPRIPFPDSNNSFWKTVALGNSLLSLHLFEAPDLDNYITEYPANGNNIVTKIRYDRTNVYINDTQYFGNVPVVAWEFYIGGYQPAQKWLKDRKERQLSFDEILHYQKMIVALVETDRLMKEIDDVIEID